jgi:hypothetical protein
VLVCFDILCAILDPALKRSEAGLQCLTTTAVAGNVKGEVNEGSVERIRARGAVRCLYWDCGSAVF